MFRRPVTKLKVSKKTIQKWVDALRSGEYLKGRSALEKDGEFCCLGVACKIFIPAELQQRSKGRLVGALPSTGQPHSPKWLNSVNDYFEALLGRSLSGLNDFGTVREGLSEFTFDEIADILQAVLIEDVLDLYTNGI